MVLELLEDGLPFEKILRDYYPHVAVADIQACIEYVKALSRERRSTSPVSWRPRPHEMAGR